MFTLADLYNMSLDRIGSSEPVRSKGDDTLEYRVCAREYPGALLRVLALYPWGCARKRATCARKADSPTWGYLYAYALPADFFSLISIDSDAARPVYAIEAGDLLTDTAPCRILYVSSGVKPEDLSAHVVELVVLELAKRILPPLKNNGTSSSQALLSELWQDAYPVAMAAEIRSGFSRPEANRLIQTWKSPREFFK